MIILSVLILSTIIGYVEYSLFKESINRKNDLIDTLTKQVAVKSRQQTQQQLAPPSSRAEQPTGSATTSDANSPAITGSGNTVGYGDKKNPEPKQPKR
jgi:hypothetical protein